MELVIYVFGAYWFYGGDGRSALEENMVGAVMMLAERLG